MSRWIRVHTSIFDHDMFADEPFSEREAWLWMIARAAWKDTIHRVGSQVLPVPTGSFFATIRDMQSAWKWTSTRRVSSFLTILQNQGMVETCSETGKTRVTICNYSKYQTVRDVSETPSETVLKHQRNTDETLKTPITPITPISSSLRSEDSAAKSRADVGLFKAELTELLDAERLDAICAIRRKKKAAFSAHAGKLLFKALSACPDPRAAADEMILRNWTSVKPEWLEKNAGRQQSTAPPRHETAHARHQRECREFNERRLGGNQRDDFTSNSPIIDISARDFRPH